jgi:hypothetical protein
MYIHMCVLVMYLCIWYIAYQLVRRAAEIFHGIVTKQENILEKIEISDCRDIRRTQRTVRKPVC